MRKHLWQARTYFHAVLGIMSVCLILLVQVILPDIPGSEGQRWIRSSLSDATSLVSNLNDPSTSVLPPISSVPVSKGAHIDESRVTKTLYVDNTAITAVMGIGSQEQPFTSIQQALTAAKADLLAGTGVRVVIKPGVYREELYLEGNGEDNAPLIIESGGSGQVMISGADVLSNWQPVSGSPGLYQHPWTNNWGAIENPWRKQFGQGKEAAYPDFRREMVYLDGKPLSQRLNRANLRLGSFFVDEAADNILLWAPTGIDINSVLVEGAMRSANQDFGVLKTYQLNNLVLRNLTVTQGSVAVWGSTRLSGNNILIENCHFDRNNGAGLAVTGEQITIRGTTANENGHAGMLLEGSSFLLEQSEASWNGWKMKEWGYEDCSGAGIKFFNSRNLLVQNMTFVGNSYPGIWFDGGVTDVTVDNLLALANDSAGFDWEISDDLRVSRLYSVYNKVGWRSFDGSRVTLENSVIAFNRTLQMFTANTARNYDTKDWTMRNVTIAADVNSQNLLWDTWPHEPGSYRVDPDTAMDQFAATLTASNNTYFHPLFDAAFRSGNGSPLSLAQWQSYTGQEVGSVWDRNTVKVTMDSLKIAIEQQWGNPKPNGLGYHDYPQLPW